MSEYANSLPLFFSVCQNIADSNPKVRYLCAVDDSKNSLEDIVKVTVVKLFSNQTSSSVCRKMQVLL